MNDTPVPGKLPHFCLSRRCAFRTDPEALRTFFTNRRTVLRNMATVGFTGLAWSMALRVVQPLVALQLLDIGVHEGIQATINSINGWLVSFLVMLFGWMSDHTVSRWGRRNPYLFISTPLIVIFYALFPFIAHPAYVWLVLVLMGVQLLAMDCKDSTFALTFIDCMPRDILARTNAILGIVSGLVGFAVTYSAGALTEMKGWVPYAIGSAVMLLGTFVALWIREPPVYHPPTERFKPWSTFKVAAEDKRIFFLIVGVALMLSYSRTVGIWLWFWAKETLGLTRKEIFQSIAWAELINVALSYPVGWAIDKIGGLKMVVAHWLLMIPCFIYALMVHDKQGLVLLVLMQTVAFPLYRAADIMVYKNTHPKDIGAITSTNSCIRNSFLALLNLVIGWVIFWTGHNYRIGFAIGFAMSSVGLIFFFIHDRLMRRGGPAIAEPFQLHPQPAAK